jgi:poly(rC)-binding protein 2/3/4
MPTFSPAQEALFLIHDRILESDSGGYNGRFGNNVDDEDDYGPRGGVNRVVTRLVVSRMHVGCLLGKGGKIIEQMRMETKTHIRVLPRDHNLPRCVDMSEEIVQVVGDMNNVKNAISIISSRLRESQHRDRTPFPSRVHSPDRFYPPDDEFAPQMNNNASRRSGPDGNAYGSRYSASINGGRNNSYGSRQSGYPNESDINYVTDNPQPFYEDHVFRILCPINKVGVLFGEPDGIIDLLQTEVGVEVKITDPVVGSDEQIITILSEEAPDDELFPAQEALLHIQTCIVDIVPDKENFVKTRLLVSSVDIGCLDGFLVDMKRVTGANVQILPREELPVIVSANDELVQIEGEIKAARDALVEVTARLRNHLNGEVFQKEMFTPPISSASPVNSEAASYQNPPHVALAPPAKDPGGSDAVKQSEDVVPSATSNRLAVPLVTRSTLEVVIPPHAVPKLSTKNKLSLISELSGANVRLLEDKPDATENIIQISGTPEQAERAQSLLQGFILSTQEDS